METLRKLLKKLKILFFENIYTRKVNINLDRAILSFTFDDVPISAAKNGAEILESANITGTFYVALGMGKTENHNSVRPREFINEKEIRALYDKGHDIGCHTYSHLNLRRTRAFYAYNDCKKNTDLITAITKAISIEHFAYPFGMLNPTVKKVLRNKYKTLRTVDTGLNVGITDMTHLKTVRLYSESFDKDEILRFVKEAIKSKAWLIFVTHDVCEIPSQWGISIKDFKWIVEQCVLTNAAILNVNDAYRKITLSNGNGSVIDL